MGIKSDNQQITNFSRSPRIPVQVDMNSWTKTKPVGLAQLGDPSGFLIQLTGSASLGHQKHMRPVYAFKPGEQTLYFIQILRRIYHEFHLVRIRLHKRIENF